MLTLRSRTPIPRPRGLVGGPLHTLLDDAAEADGAITHTQKATIADLALHD